jgi:hypothetical protein
MPCEYAISRLHEELPQKNALAQSENSTLRRRLPIVHDYKGGGAHLTATT